MYEEFYDLVDKPFELMPDPRYVFLSAHHREALAHLKYGVEERKGFVQLTGEVGTGKTTMLNVLISELDASTAVSRLSHTTVNELDLLRLIARGFGIEVETDSKAVVLDRLRERLSAWSKDGRNAVVVVDEAQDLTPPVLEEIRLVSNLEIEGRSGLQIILAGQPELREILDRPELRQLRQRIAIKYHLMPLSRQETSQYVAHRMAVAGGSASIFAPKAVEAIHEHAQGVPRVINMLCDRALLAGYAESKRSITYEMAAKAVDSLEGTPIVKRARAPVPKAPARVRPSRERLPQGVRVRWAVPLVAALVVVAVTLSAALYLEERDRATAPGGDGISTREAWASEQPVAPGGGPDQSDAEPAPGTAAGQSELTPDRTTASDSRPVAEATEGDAPGGIEADREDGEETIASVPSDAGGWEPPSGGSDYFVVAQSTDDRGLAAGEADELRGSGYDASVWTVDLGDRGVWHRVVLSAGYETLSDATGVLEALKGMSYDEAWIVKR